MRLAKLTSNRGLTTMTGMTCLATAVACSGGNPPELTGLSDQVAQVGTELKIDLSATDVDGDKLTYDFRAPDLHDLAGHAQMTVSPSGAGVFRWTPLAEDVGEHAFDFIVSDGGHATTVTININVRSAIGSATAPIFRQPLGTGTTIDLAHSTCVDLDIVLDDQDTPMLTIAQEEPLIDGATLTVQDGQTATWHWCPTHAQTGDLRYTLVLSADDGDNPKTIKDYLIVLRSGTGSTCPGTAPVITHTVANATTRLDLKPMATVTDDKGLKDSPLLYYSTTAPAAVPNLSHMTQLSTTRLSGTSKNGQYAASVPNPVASAAAGTTAKLYYLFVADDDDDTMGNCDHTTQSPVYTMTVTAGGTATAGLCQACTADSQCGTGNECVYMGSMGDSFCVQACGTGCPAGYSCSASTIYSVDGKLLNQCLPQSGSCQAPTGACADDSWESNDTQSAASANPVLTPNLYDLVSCPSTTSTTRANDDWYRLVVAADARVNLEIAGDGATDVDLHLYHSDGTVVSSSTSSNPNEQLNSCLKKATYYVKVNGFGHARSEYLLQYDSTPEACNTTCVDDTHEDDDTYSQARATTYPTFSSTASVICPNDDDWYKVKLFAGETMTMDLMFTETTSSQDLDLHLYTDTVHDLWPCDVAHPGTCTTAHGQGASSNEHAVFSAPSTCLAGCNYYVVVRGWNGSTNTYGITLGIH